MVDSIPVLWPDATVFIIGGGPTISSVNFDLIKSRRIIAVNNAYGDRVDIKEDGKASRYNPRHWVDVCFFGDVRWFHWHRKWLKDFSGIIASCCDDEATKQQNPNLVWFKRGKREGFDERPMHVGWNGNSGAAAINAAYHLGARKVVLLGFDMKKVDGKGNYHNDHPRHTDMYYRYIGKMKHLAIGAKKFGLEIINCSPISSLEYWPIMTLEQFLETEKSQ